jgi:hypothetical protein
VRSVGLDLFYGKRGERNILYTVALSFLTPCLDKKYKKTKQDVFLCPENVTNNS